MFFTRTQQQGQMIKYSAPRDFKPYRNLEAVNPDVEVILARNNRPPSRPPSASASKNIKMLGILVTARLSDKVPRNFFPDLVMNFCRSF